MRLSLIARSTGWVRRPPRFGHLPEVWRPFHFAASAKIGGKNLHETAHCGASPLVEIRCPVDDGMARAASSPKSPVESASFGITFSTKAFIWNPKCPLSR
jgi:hypothetical protein